MAGKTVGIFATDKVGTALARIMKGLGCKLLGCDTRRNPICVELDIK
jgi:D-lactate dehydrogenase